MKKIYVFAALLMTGFAANAQRNLTLKCEVVNPTYNQNITTGSSVSFQYKIYNNSATAADSLQQGDTIKIFDPQSVFTSGTGLTTYSGNVILSSSISKGGTLTINTSTPLPFANILTLADPADALNYKSAPFTANKQYAWFFSIYQIAIPAGNRPLASTSTATSDTGLVWINKGSSINEISASKATVNVFPNPAVNEINVDYTFTTNENASIAIVDLAGRTIMSKQYSNQSGNQKFNFDISNLQSGNYFVNFVVGNDTYMTKFTVVK